MTNETTVVVTGAVMDKASKTIMPVVISDTDTNKIEMIMPPRGRLNPAIITRMAQTRSVADASEQAQLMMVAQAHIGPRLALEPKVPRKTSAQRRAARIAAGKLAVVDGRLVGAR